MKKKLFVLLLIFVSIFSLFSFYSPFTKLKKIETENYFIYFPEHLSSLIDNDLIKFMEDSYSKLSSLFKYKFKYKVNVYFSDTDKVSNGFSSPIGRSSIYIITTPPPINLSLGNMSEWLKYVFYHELTHQFSLALQNKFLEFLGGFFGNIFVVNAFNNPGFMIEGITTSFERLDKEYGRVFDPEIKQYIMQDIIDKTIRNPYQLESSYDAVWPYHSLIYWYGGFFSYFLQQKYGMEKYIQYWQNTLTTDYNKAFKLVYEKELIELWNEFYEYMKPQFEIKVNSDDLLKYNNKNFLFKGKISKEGDNYFYYYYNNNDKRIERLNLKNKKVEIVIKNLYTFINYEISNDGEKILLSYIDYLPNNNIAIKHKIFDIKKKKFIKSSIEKFISLSEVNFYKNDKIEGFVAIDIDRSMTDLVLIDKNGSKKVLLEGNKYFYIANPIQYNDEIYFLGSYKANKSLYKFNIIENKLIKLETNAKNINNINIFNDKLFYSYNNDFTMNKFGYIDLKDNIEKDFLENYSGGFFNPVIINDEVIYIGRYSRFCRVQSLKIDEKSENFYKNNLNYLTFDLNKDKAENYLEKYFINQVQKETKNEIAEKNENVSNSNDLMNNNLIKKSSDTIYPFEQFTLIPDLRVPLFPLINTFNNTINFGGLGYMLAWYHNVSGSLYYINLGANLIDKNLYPSIQLMAGLNYSHPFTILLYFEYSHNLDLAKAIIAKEYDYKRLLNGEIQIGYYKYLSFPTKVNYILFKTIAGYYKSWDYQNSQFIFDKSLTYISGIIKYLNDLGIQYDSDAISITNNIYLSRFINLNNEIQDNIKFENEISLILYSLNTILTNQFVISKNKNLKFIHKNNYYYYTILDNFNDLYYGNYNDEDKNIMNYLNFELILLDQNINNFVFNFIGFNRGIVKTGFRYYIAGNTDIDFNNYLKEYFVFVNLELMSSNIASSILNISYSIKEKKYLIYFDYVYYLF